MPSMSNILAPINIHGIGRSGTSLLQNIFGSTGFIQVCNETQGLLFCSYRGGELLNSSHDKEIAKSLRTPHDAVRAVHGCYIATMPSSKSAWSQKVGGIPNYVELSSMIVDGDKDFSENPYNYPYTWYWNVLRNSFPLSYDILILRDFRDVVVSRSKYSGFKVDDICGDIAVYANILTHPMAKFDNVIFYEDLVGRPKEILPRIFEKADISYRDEYMRAMSWHAAPSRERSLTEAGNTGFRWSQEYESILGKDRSEKLERTHQELRNHFLKRELC